LKKILADISNFFFGFLIVESFDYSGNIFVTQIKPNVTLFALIKSFMLLPIKGITTK